MQRGEIPKIERGEVPKVTKQAVHYTGRGEQAPMPTSRYHPDHIIGVCSHCHTQGTLEFPPGTFDWDKGDRLMSLDVLKKVYCLKCRQYTEFVPYDPKKHGPLDMLQQNQRDILRNL